MDGQKTTTSKFRGARGRVPSWAIRGEAPRAVAASRLRPSAMEPIWLDFMFEDVPDNLAAFHSACAGAGCEGSVQLADRFRLGTGAAFSSNGGSQRRPPPSRIPPCGSGHARMARFRTSVAISSPNGGRRGCRASHWVRSVDISGQLSAAALPLWRPRMLTGPPKGKRSGTASGPSPARAGPAGSARAATSEAA